MKIVRRKPTQEMLDATGLRREATQVYLAMYDAAPDMTEELFEKIKAAAQGACDFEDLRTIAGYYDDDSWQQVCNWDKIARAVLAAIREA